MGIILSKYSNQLQTLDFIHHHPPRSLSSLSCSSSSSCMIPNTRLLQRNILSICLNCRYTYCLPYGVDKEESSVMMEVKLDEMKLWLVIITWLLLWELSTPKVTLLQLPSFSDASSAERVSCWRKTWMGTWWKTSQPNGKLKRKTKRPMRTF